MNRYRLAIAAVLSITLFGCATPKPRQFAAPTDYVPIDKIAIENRFDSVEVTHDNFAAEMKKCIPQLDGNSAHIKKALQNLPTKNILGFGHASSGNIFTIYKSTALCLHRSSNKYAILAAEAILETSNPSGIPQAVEMDWNKQIVKLIATKGRANVAYTFPNGNAFAVSYWVLRGQDFMLQYSTTFKKAGTWEADKFDVKFSHPSMNSVSEVKRSGHPRKNFPIEHRMK
ncbi:MAG: hypothetical protein ABII81_06530 [Pseudomonadota bacterium]